MDNPGIGPGSPFKGQPMDHRAPSPLPESGRAGLFHKVIAALGLRFEPVSEDVENPAKVLTEGAREIEENTFSAGDLTVSKRDVSAPEDGHEKLPMTDVTPGTHFSTATYRPESIAAAAFERTFSIGDSNARLDDSPVASRDRALPSRIDLAAHDATILQRLPAIISFGSAAMDDQTGHGPTDPGLVPLPSGLTNAVADRQAHDPRNTVLSDMPRSTGPVSVSMGAMQTVIDPSFSRSAVLVEQMGFAVAISSRSGTVPSEVGSYSLRSDLPTLESLTAYATTQPTAGSSPRAESALIYGAAALIERHAGASPPFATQSGAGAGMTLTSSSSPLFSTAQGPAQAPCGLNPVLRRAPVSAIDAARSGDPATTASVQKVRSDQPNWQDKTVRTVQPLYGAAALPAGLQPNRPEIQPLDISPLGLAPIEARAASTLSPTAVAPGTMAQQAAVLVQQLVQVTGQLSRGPIELTLSPEELGRVRMTLTSGENGMVLTVLADREETLALLRRNIDLLSNDLRDLGHANLSFQFGSGGSGAGHPDSSPGGSARATGHDLPEEAGFSHKPQSTPRPANDRLDLRL